MIFSAIAALARNRVIGQGNGLPWRLPGDLKFFKATTLGKPVVMGRKTFQSIGKPLPGRPNIVVTRDPGFAAEGVHVARDIESALDLAATLARETDAGEVMVIGGAEIYAQALPRLDRLYLTEIDAEIAGDAYFPEIEPRAWREADRSNPVLDEASGLSYCFITLHRVGA
ncbi:MAG: type 3 dihydrofolate reductase [Oceanibaculum nanhaiense]|jgi:dihydrofolate reductase|uniref:type 3 dihydrofolate reductase n=1 Tax=Oceanibaculum nanhaiense TaxID=1909734 RepID=UPI0032F06D71